MTTDAPPQSAWRALLSAAADEWRATPLYRLGLRGEDPDRVSQWGRDPRRGDPARGAEILAGLWRIGAERLGGEVRIPWAAGHPSRAFTARLHSFSWLADLSAAPDCAPAVSRLVDSWVEAFGEWHEAAWAPELTAERLLAWLCHGRAAFENGDPENRPALMRSLGRQSRHLMLAAKDIRDPPAKLCAGAAMILAGAAGLPEGERLIDEGEESLLEAAASQFYADGGHLSRSPETLFEALCTLLIADDALVRRGAETPAMIRLLMPKLADHLRLLMLGDGGLGCFQGGGEGDPASIARVLGEVGAPTRRFSFASQSGYQRIEAGELVLVMDVGGPPPPAFGARAHAGALAFELSCGRERLIVNVGAGRELDPAWRAAARATNAHTTLAVDDALNAPFAKARRQRAGASPTGPSVAMKRSQDEAGVWVEGQHDGYRQRFGFMTRRVLFMDAAGRTVLGSDSLARPVNAGLTQNTAPLPFAVRFHLHPGVVAKPLDDRTVSLETQSGARWRLLTDAPDMALESSIYLGGAVKPLRAAQIVLHGQADPNGSGEGSPNRIRWSLKRAD